MIETEEGLVLFLETPSVCMWGEEIETKFGGVFVVMMCEFQARDVIETNILEQQFYLARYLCSESLRG